MIIYDPSSGLTREAVATSQPVPLVYTPSGQLNTGKPPTVGSLVAQFLSGEWGWKQYGAMLVIVYIAYRLLK